MKARDKFYKILRALRIPLYLYVSYNLGKWAIYGMSGILFHLSYEKYIAYIIFIWSAITMGGILLWKIFYIAGKIHDHFKNSKKYYCEKCGEKFDNAKYFNIHEEVGICERIINIKKAFGDEI